MYNKDTHLSTHFSRKEITFSETALKYNISNEPNEEQWENIQALVDNILEPLRVKLNSPIVVNSVFRSQKLNDKVSQSNKSQHLANNGAAADIECPELGNRKLFETILTNFNFDQLIWEFGDNSNPDWVHVSYVSENSNRKNVLKAIRNSNGLTTYVNYKI